MSRWIDAGRITGELAAIVFVSIFAATWMYHHAVIYRGDVIVLTRAEHEALRGTMEAAQRASRPHAADAEPARVRRCLVAVATPPATMERPMRNNYRYLWEPPPQWPQPLRALNALIVVGVLIGARSAVRRRVRPRPTARAPEAPWEWAHLTFNGAFAGLLEITDVLPMGATRALS